MRIKCLAQRHYSCRHQIRTGTYLTIKSSWTLSTEPQELPNNNLIDIDLLMDKYKWVNWILVLLNELVLFARSFIEYF